jgi:epoxyqueuosine reductase
MEISKLTALVTQAAFNAGFDVVGIAGVSEAPELDYFPEWIARGHAGEMKYMEQRDEAGVLKRTSLRRVAPWAQSVIVCAINYNTDQPYSTQISDSKHGWISRYAWSHEDYHDGVMRRLRGVENRLRQLFSSDHADQNETQPRMYAGYRGSDSVREDCAGTLASDSRDAHPDIVGELQTRCYVDTGPLVERVYAKYAGVGWIGKNTCIINQKLGSWLFLGVILTSLELTPDFPAPDRCGTCTRCIDACPTDALIAPYQLDSNRCISYLTIEKRGTIPEDMRDGMGRHVYGCDICQDVCPWNRRAPSTAVQEFQPRPGLVNPALDWLAEMKAEEFRETFRGSPIKRTKLSGLRRNAVIAMGNSGKREFIPELESLACDDDSIVAEAAAWSLGKLREQREEKIFTAEAAENAEKTSQQHSSCD